MKKALATLLLLLPLTLLAQRTTVTAVVKDSSNALYAGGAYNIHLVTSPPSGVTPTLGGREITQTEVVGKLDSAANLSVVLWDNNQISPAGSQWRFSICSQDKLTCFATNVTITGTSQSVTSELQAAAVALPSTSGALLAANNTWTGTNTFQDTVTVPTPSNSTDAAQKAQVDAKADDSAVVHKTGIESVAGAKTLTNGLTVQTSDSNGVLLRPQADVDGFTLIPSADSQTTVGFGITNAANNAWVVKLQKNGLGVLASLQVTGLSACNNATTQKLIADGSGNIICGSEQVGSPGTGITSLNGATGTTQNFANGAGITVTTNTGTNTHSIAFSGDKTTVGLGNVDNTSDAAKPISTATQTALDGKASITRQLTFPVGTDDGAALVDTQDYPVVWRNHFGFTFTITAIYCETDTGSSRINLTHNDGSPAAISASNLDCATTEATSTSFSGSENVIADGQAIGFTMVTAALSGTPHKVLVTIVGHE
jgi:hypothetical protein